MLIALNKKLASIISCDQKKISQGYDSIQSFLWFQSVNYDVPSGSEISYLKNKSSEIWLFQKVKFFMVCIKGYQKFYDMYKRMIKHFDKSKKQSNSSSTLVWSEMFYAL